jgi:polysaccharide export outer membrane protein
MLNLLISLALVAVQAAAPAAQKPAAPAPGTPKPAAPQAAPVTQTNPAYIVGPNDVLGVKVFGEVDLSSTYSVDGDGTISFPFLGRVPVGGKTVQEIEFALTKLLADGYLSRPQVSVVITSYRSRVIYVLGEVRSPSKYTIEGQTTLLEVIAQAGSFMPNAAQTINILRYKDGLAGVVAGAPVTPGDPRGAEILRINREDLSEGRLQSNIILQDGDTIFVPTAEKFYVMGFVKTPGQFVLQPGMTVRQALSLAGGLTERGSDRRIKIIRKVNNKDVELDADMSDLVRPNDTIRVPQRLI